MLCNRRNKKSDYTMLPENPFPTCLLCECERLKNLDDLFSVGSYFTVGFK